MTSIVAPIGPIDITPPGAGGGDPTVDTPYVPFVVPVGSDGYVPTELITPFVDPFQHTFRASSVADMFRIIPDMGLYWNDLEIHGDTGIASFKFDIGVASKICPLYVTFQNRTVSHNLWIQLELPPYLRQDPGPEPERHNNDIGNSFLIPHRGNIHTPPVSIRPGIIRAGAYGTDTDRFTFNTLTIIGSLPTVEWRDTGTGTGDQPVPDNYWEGSGEGIINIKLIFVDALANLLMPGNLLDEIIVKVTPMAVYGPVYVDKYAAIPNDLNTLIECHMDDPPDVPRDRDEPDDPDDPTCEPESLIEYVEVEKEVFLEDDKFRWINGTTGETEEGFPPSNWYAGPDGRMYPPLIETDMCIDGLGKDSITIFEGLILRSANVPASFGTETTRKVYIIDTGPYLTGENATYVRAHSLHMVVADSVPHQPFFKLLGAYKSTYRDNEPIPIPQTDEFKDYWNRLNTAIPVAKEGKEDCGLASWFSEKTRDECFMWRLAENEISSIDTNEINVQVARVWTTGADIIDTIQNEGSGILIPQWKLMAEEIAKRQAAEFLDNTNPTESP